MIFKVQYGYSLDEWEEVEATAHHISEFSNTQRVVATFKEWVFFTIVQED
jgi:hypothetical protein